jgi:hypothetical protein
MKATVGRVHGKSWRREAKRDLQLACLPKSHPSRSPPRTSAILHATCLGFLGIKHWFRASGYCMSSQHAGHPSRQCLAVRSHCASLVLRHRAVVVASKADVVACISAKQLPMASPHHDPSRTAPWSWSRNVALRASADSRALQCPGRRASRPNAYQRILRPTIGLQCCHATGRGAPAASQCPGRE